MHKLENRVFIFIFIFIFIFFTYRILSLTLFLFFCLFYLTLSISLMFPLTHMNLSILFGFLALSTSQNYKGEQVYLQAKKLLPPRLNATNLVDDISLSSSSFQRRDLVDGLHSFHNTPLWMSTLQEYASLKSYQEKTQREKNPSEGKRVQHSCLYYAQKKLPY